MDIATLPQLLDNLEKSTLVSAQQLANLRKAAVGQTDSQAFARAMAKQGLVTRWQAGQLLVGRTSFMLGKYRLLDLLGRGGMGQVYLAEHATMQRRAALKLLPSKLSRDPNARERFFAEARAAAALDHANIVRAYDVQDEDDRYFLVMEYVDGKDLQRVVEEQGPLDYATAADAIRQAAEGLAHAHSRNMIHCDIKPANLLVTKQGTIKILDMGLARATGDARDKSDSGEQQVAGTVDYMAPEQALGDHTFDQRADIYSLGCTLYFLLAGQPPFPEGTVAQRIVKHQVDEPPSILKKRPDAPKSLLKILRKMTAKEPSQRYQQAAEAAQALRDWEPKQQELKRAIPLDQAPADASDPLAELLGLGGGTVAKKTAADKPAAPAKPTATPMQKWAIPAAITVVALSAAAALVVAWVVLTKESQKGAQTPPPLAAPKVEKTLKAEEKQGADVGQGSFAGRLESIRASEPQAADPPKASPPPAKSAKPKPAPAPKTPAAKPGEKKTPDPKAAAKTTADAKVAAKESADPKAADKKAVDPKASPPAKADK